MTNLRLSKFITGVGFIGLTVALVSSVVGKLAHMWELDLSFAVLSLAALMLTAFRLKEYLHSLEDRMTLRLLFVPMTLNMLLSSYALISTADNQVRALAVLGLLGWAMVIVSMRQAFKAYIPFGRGFLPKDVWINPPVKVMQEGDAILVRGNMANFLREAMGHCETIVRGRDGRLYTFSALIEAGTTWRLLDELIQSYHDGGYDYIVLRLNKPFSREEREQAVEVVEGMMARNKTWTEMSRIAFREMVAGLPLPKGFKERLITKHLPTGYDVIGKYWGGLREGRWTCIACNIYLLQVLGRQMAEYGTGMFGLFGEFNPILPIRLIRDPQYRWLTTVDRDNSATAA